MGKGVFRGTNRWGFCFRMIIHIKDCEHGSRETGLSRPGLYKALKSHWWPEKNGRPAPSLLLLNGRGNCRNATHQWFGIYL